MKKLLALTILLTLGMGSSVWAEHCPEVVSSETAYVCTQEVFNDSGSTLTSGTVVVWDQADTDFNTSGRPYVIATTTADDPWTAGVMLTGSCPDQQLCEMVTRGITRVRIANSTDDTAVDTQVGATTVSGQAGDYATGANTCMLGTLVDYVNGIDLANDNLEARVFIDISCD